VKKDNFVAVGPLCLHISLYFQQGKARFLIRLVSIIETVLARLLTSFCQKRPKNLNIKKANSFEQTFVAFFSTIYLPGFLLTKKHNSIIFFPHLVERRCQYWSNQSHFAKLVRSKPLLTLKIAESSGLGQNN